MASKEVTDRGRSTMTAASMMTSYAAPIGEGAAAALSKYLREGEVMPDVGFVMTLLARMIDDNRRQLGAADEANERERADDAKPREDRDRTKVSAFELVVTIRDSIAANYGPLGLAALGLRDPCPNTPLGTARYGRALINALRDVANVALPPPRSRSFTLDRAGLAAEVEAEIAPLEAAIDAVATEESEAKGTQSKKDQAMAANDTGFSIATGIARHVFRLCGLVDLANRITESKRHPGQLEDPAPEDVTT